MTRLKQVKTTFTSGQVTPDLLGRGDLRAYENGAALLKNVFIRPTGGVTRRAGLYYMATAAGKGRLIAFEFNTEQTYLLLLTNYQITVYSGASVVATITTPWAEADIKNVAWTQSADTLLLVHANTPPKKLTRSTGGVFSLQDWAFFTKNNIIKQPYYKFADSAVTLTPSAMTGTITLTASAPVFMPTHEGVHIRVNGKQALITDYDSPTVITAQLHENLSSTTATIDWEEAAFSAARGYPSSVAFHQDRLVIGGSRDLPNRLWLSASGDLFNFDLGTGLDDEAIEFGILSDQVNAIRAVFSGRHLQIFTSGAEFMVTGEPLTPQNIQVRRQTRVGSITTRYIPPLDVDGATLFVAKSGKELREFIYTDVEQAYQASDLALLSREIIISAIDQDYDAGRRLVFLVREDGKFATLTVYRAEQVAAWTIHETDGFVHSVSVVGEKVYFLVERGSAYFIEQFDDDVFLDSALTGSAGAPTTSWSGLGHLNGKDVMIVADGKVTGPKMVTAGAVTLDVAAQNVVIGLPYTHRIEPLPPGNITEGGTATAMRLVRAAFRLQNTAALQVDMGRGLTEISLRDLYGSDVLDAPPPKVTGDINIRALGWQSDKTKPLWVIEHDVPLPFTLLSVLTEIKISE